ncbi:MAG: acyltransferase [Clostridia bacterium]|nr:acyltransferase [Clostridia bacterium]
MSAPSTQKPQMHLDLLRLFAAFCVIALHVLAPWHSSLPDFGTRTWHVVNILNEVTRTGVPLFLMLTGCLLLPSPSTREFGPFYRRRLSRILIPFAVWDVVYFVVYRVEAGQPLSLRAFVDELLNQGSAYHFWYVYTLAAIYLLLPFLARALEGCTNRQIFWLVILAAFPATLRIFFNITTPFYLYLTEPLMEGYLGYVILGYWLSRIKLSRLTAWAVPICGIGGWVMGVCFNYFRSSPEGLDLYFNGGYTLNHYLFAAALFLGARHLRLPASEKLGKFLHRLSGLTYTVYLAHVLMLALVARILPMPTPALEIAVYPPVCFVLCLVLAWGLDLGKRGIRRLLPRRKEAA